MEPNDHVLLVQTRSYNDYLAKKKACQLLSQCGSNSLTLTPANNNAFELKKYRT